MEYGGSGQLLRRYVYGPGIDEPICMKTASSAYYYHFDALGSAIALTGSNGQKVETYAYSPYGKVSQPSSLGNPYLYTGREYDGETGLYYYRARYYHLEIGRFSQVDPIRYAGGLHLYSYVNNSPVNFIDPMGMEAEEDQYSDEELFGALAAATMMEPEKDPERKMLALGLPQTQASLILYGSQAYAKETSESSSEREEKIVGALKLYAFRRILDRELKAREKIRKSKRNYNVHSAHLNLYEYVEAGNDYEILRKQIEKEESEIRRCEAALKKLWPISSISMFGW
jgi:RHS repeat-associated protein